MGRQNISNNTPLPRTTASEPAVYYAQVRLEWGRREDET